MSNLDFRSKSFADCRLKIMNSKLVSLLSDYYCPNTSASYKLPLRLLSHSGYFCLFVFFSLCSFMSLFIFIYNALFVMDALPSDNVSLNYYFFSLLSLRQSYSAYHLIMIWPFVYADVRYT